jgi:hypothetical protein
MASQLNIYTKEWQDFKTNLRFKWFKNNESEEDLFLQG